MEHASCALAGLVALGGGLNGASAVVATTSASAHQTVDANGLFPVGLAALALVLRRCRGA